MQIAEGDLSHRAEVTGSDENGRLCQSDVLKKIQPSIDQKGLTAFFDPGFSSLLTGDVDALRTAWLNIVDNAVKFTPENGDIKIQMDWELDVFTLRLTNTQSSFPADELSRMFDPFHRVKQTQTPGSGLGLAIKKNH